MNKDWKQHKLNFKTFIRNSYVIQGKKLIRQGETLSAEHCFGNKTIPTTVTTTRRENGHRQDTQIGTEI